MTDDEALASLVGQKITGIESVKWDDEPAVMLVLGDGRQILFPVDTICIETTTKWHLN